MYCCPIILYGSETWALEVISDPNSVTKSLLSYLRHRNATEIRTGEFSVRARRINASNLVGSIFAVVFMIAFPRFEYTPAVGTSELVGTARVVSCEIKSLLRDCLQTKKYTQIRYETTLYRV